MSGFETVMFQPAPLAALAATGVGLAALWANPQRWMNRFFFTSSLHVGVWLLSVHLARSTSELWWGRMAASVGAFLPAHLWMIQRASITNDVADLFRIKDCWRLAAASAFAALCFSDFYIPEHSTTEQPIFGLGYYVYVFGLVGLYVSLCRDTVRQIKSQSGIAKIELQILLLGGSATALAVILLMGLRPLGIRAPWSGGLQPLLVLLFYSGTVVAMTTSRIFDARQITLVALQKAALVTAISLGAFLVNHMAGMLVPEAVAFFVSVALGLWGASVMNRWLNRAFNFYPEAVAARHAAFSASQSESRIDRLEAAFRTLLRGWGQSEHSVIFSAVNGSNSAGEFAANRSVLVAMRQLRWATPERLARERLSPERLQVRRFLSEHALGVLVMQEGPGLLALVGVGVPASRRPFTYPQVTQLMELASIMESALERAHFSAKVQHAAQLATVGMLGASLAHEIRNPLVSIKTFAQLLPHHHQDPAFREKFFRLIGEEVRRIDLLTEQLLDLASPRTYHSQSIDLHPVLMASLDLVAAKAAHKNVQFQTDLRAQPDRTYTDPSAAKQVMLNLCFNAIQAVESLPQEQPWVRISTRNTPAGIEMAVSDSGPGISPEIRPHLFQPFQTTKSTGFGLGLAICRDILVNLDATISVDPPAAGCGATFRVTFPCQRSSS